MRGRVYRAGTIARYDDMLKIKGQNIWPLAVEDVIFASKEVEEYNGRVYLDEGGAEEVTVAVEFKKDAAPAVTVAVKDEVLNAHPWVARFSRPSSLPSSFAIATTRMPTGRSSPGPAIWWKRRGASRGAISGNRCTSEGSRRT